MIPHLPVCQRGEFMPVSLSGPFLDFIKVAPVGIEPTTLGLPIPCSSPTVRLDISN